MKKGNFKLWTKDHNPIVHPKRTIPKISNSIDECVSVLLTRKDNSLTYKEWFELFHEPYRTKALANADYRANVSFHYKRASSALFKVFYWDGSPEKDEFWREFYEILVKNDC